MSKDSDNWDQFVMGDDEGGSSPEAPAAPLVEDKTGIRWSLIAGLILIAAIAVLAAQNTQRVSVNFLGWNGRAPLIAVILGTAIVAILLDETLGFFWRRSRRKRRAEREELKRLRARAD